MSAEEIRDQMRARGWAFVEGGYTEQELRSLREALDALHQRFGSPRFYAKDPDWIAPGVEIAGPGLAFYGLLGFIPEIAPLLYKPELVAALRASLGEDMHLELIGGILSDETRPFTGWETHLGGIDDERWRRQGRRPQRESIKRVITFHFLEALTDETGPWRVLPRALGDSMEPAGPIHDLDWPGARELTCPAGSVILLDESVWHGVVPRRVPGRRRLLGSIFASAEAESTFKRDESLDAFAEADGPLASLLARK